MVDVTYLPQRQPAIEISAGTALRNPLSRWIRKWRKPIGLTGIVGIALAQGNVVGMWLVGLIPTSITEPTTYLAASAAIVGAPLICNIIRWSRFR
jgi:zinc transporter ZupT